MDRFIARENIRHFRDLLFSDIEPEQRTKVLKLLVREEDRLPKDAERLADIERDIADGDQRIEAQRARVSALQTDGDGEAARAQTFLDAMIESQSVTVKYREIVVLEIERNCL
jgi:hypothetical protein